VSVNSCPSQLPGNERVKEQVIDPQTRVASIRIAEIIPESIDFFARMKRSNRVCPTLFEQPVIGRPGLRPE
jgi:hypothetical protein